MQLDWIEGTIVNKPVGESLAVVKGILGATAWQELEHGGWGYECSALVCDSGRVYWSYVHPRMGVHVSLPSSAISASGQEPRELLVQLLQSGVELTRVDFAFDDKDGLLDLKQVKQAILGENFVSRFRKWRLIENNEGGKTWSFGSRSSNSYMRIYDKAAEQHVEGHWVRVELELKKERANEAVKVLLFDSPVDDWPGRVASWVLGLLDFKEPGSDSNKRRWVTVEWWEAFLECAKKSGLSIPGSARTVDELRAWVEKQVAPSLFVLSMTFGYDDLLHMIGEASERPKAKHLAMIDSASRRVGESKQSERVEGDRGE